MDSIYKYSIMYYQIGMNKIKTISEKYQVFRHIDF